MIETHPFGIFIPPRARYLMLGSFTGQSVNSKSDPGYDWYYGTRRNQFWRIMENVYSISLPFKEEKIFLFTNLKIALGDVILQCERVKNSNLDVNLINIVYNTVNVEKTLNENNIQAIFFTSRFVEAKYRQHFKHLMQKFPNIKLVTLPSPSPRYAVVKLSEKISIYRSLLPPLEKP